MTARPKTCLIVDDDHLIVSYLTTLVEGLGHTVCAVAHEADDAAKKALEHRPEVILMDVRLGGPRDGVDAAIEIHKHASPEIYFITGSGDPETIERINQDQPSGIFVKPVDPKALRLALTATGERREPARMTCLIVDDDRLIVERLRALVEDLGVAVCGVAYDAGTAIETAINHQPDVVLMDMRLGGELDGVDAAIEILKRARSRIVFVTAYGDPVSVERMTRNNPAGILIKPVDPRDLKRVLLG